MMPQSCPSKWLQDASFLLEQGKYCEMESPGERLEKLLAAVPDVCSKVLWRLKLGGETPNMNQKLFFGTAGTILSCFFHDASLKGFRQT